MPGRASVRHPNATFDVRVANPPNTTSNAQAMPGLPDEASVESSDAYMAGIESLTQGLPCTTALLMKGDPAPVLSTHI